ncbi:MAG: hypothetical protein IJX13_01825, partial [Clostridia bacterium]|nr:hypothetical protein [Clostridia bacterium]
SPLRKKADGRLFCAGNLRFSFASTIKYRQIMDGNCGVKPQSKNRGVSTKCETHLRHPLIT